MSRLLPGAEPLDQETQRKLARVVERLGALDARRLIGCTRSTLERAQRGDRLRAGSILLLRMAVNELDEALAAVRL